MRNNLVVVDLSHQPGPSPEPIGTVSIDIRTPPGIAVEVFVNGEPFVPDIEFHPVPR